MRASDQYPLLGGGDVNLYALFVERAMHVVEPDGMVGLLIPSGIYADKTAAPFFQSVSTRGRIIWVPAEAVRRVMPEKREWTIAYRRSNRVTDVRTMIAAIVPAVGLGDSVFLLTREDRLTAADALLLLGNLNSFGFDHVTRQKAAGTNLSWYIVEQLPVIAPEGYEHLFGDTTAGDTETLVTA